MSGTAKLDGISGTWNKTNFTLSGSSSIEELRSRLIGRGTETADVIASRLRRAAEESEGMNNYDYILINDQVEDCVDQLHQIILSERCRAQRNEELINTIQEEARIFMKGDK